SAAEGKNSALSESSKPIVDMEDFVEGMTLKQEERSENVDEGAFRILVVDDEPVNIQVLTNLLLMRNYSVSKAYNGKEALDLIERGEEFDLVLLDVMMPKMSGYEVCRHLRERYSLFDLPIVMLTAKNRVQDIVLGFQSGANDYVQKPFDKEELFARVKTLLELKNAMTAAMAANKAKSFFLANMSHEIRTPLNAVIGLTSLLAHTHMDDKQRDYTEKMHRAAVALLSIINDILDFSKIDAGGMKLEHVSFDIRRTLEDMSMFFKERNTDSDISLVIDLDPAIPMEIVGDPLRLQQIFINLVDNAYKFTEKGSVTVRVAVAERVSNEVILNFAVEDTGIGMSAKQIENIFSAFNQADNSYTRKYGGTGIGLAITRQMVELMGGKINVSSEVGKGTVFSFSCKFQIGGEISAPEELEPDESVEDADKNTVLHGLRVLLVEDNEINAMIAEELLNAVGIEVTTAENGKEALDILAETVNDGETSFDLVLMDLQMPVMDGYEATKVIRNTPEYDAIPVYALTAHAFPEERARCLELGMKDHLTKPIDANVFYGALREIAESKRRLRYSA
ncbi:MAG: response regulator, partial [Synergistaceae bacterium]|nr:response regulator [Synergistaceae bacterium]